jgi:uncharacterized protein YegL
MSNLEINPNKEYILAADISASMTTVDNLCGGNTRYEYMLEKFKQFVKIASDFDEHGKPTIMMFGQYVHVYEHCDLDKVDKLTNWKEFEGFTNLHAVIEESYDLYREDKRQLRKENKFHNGIVLMVFTDGEPTNKPAVKRILEKIVNEIDSEEDFQIVFLTVGAVSASTSKYLESLHDDLDDKSINPNDFDIIHIEKLEDVDFMQAITAKDHKGA